MSRAARECRIAVDSGRYPTFYFPKYTSPQAASRLVREGIAEWRGAMSIVVVNPTLPKAESGCDVQRQFGNSTRSPRQPIKERHSQSPEELHWRESVLLRDDYKCVFCGSDKSLEADHIKPKAIYPELRFDVDNGRTLCNPCHKQTPTYGSRVRKLVSVKVEPI